MIVTMPDTGGPLIDAIDGIRFVSTRIAVPDVLVPLGVYTLLDRFHNTVYNHRARALRDPFLVWIRRSSGFITDIKIRIL